jgi:hypothetical protein
MTEEIIVKIISSKENLKDKEDTKRRLKKTDTNLVGFTDISYLHKRTSRFTGKQNSAKRRGF